MLAFGVLGVAYLDGEGSLLAKIGSGMAVLIGAGAVYAGYDAYSNATDRCPETQPATWTVRSTVEDGDRHLLYEIPTYYQLVTIYSDSYASQFQYLNPTAQPD